LVKAEARATAERQAVILDLRAATTTTLAGVRLLAGGSSHLQEEIIDNFQGAIARAGTCHDLA
jgi:hypothetical protein